MNCIVVLNGLAAVLAVVVAVCAGVAASNGMWREKGEPSEAGKAVIDKAKLVGAAAASVAAVLKLAADVLANWG